MDVLLKAHLTRPPMARLYYESSRSGLHTGLLNSSCASSTLVIEIIVWVLRTDFGGKTFLSGETWKSQRALRRGISRTPFGVDYLEQCSCPDPRAEGSAKFYGKMVELNCEDDEGKSVPLWGQFGSSRTF